MNLRMKQSKTNERIEITFIQEDAILCLHDAESTDGEAEDSSKCVEQVPSTCSLDVNYDDNSVLSELSSVSSLEGPIEDIYCTRRNSSRYRINNRVRIEPSILNNFLDFLSMCFWKCSPGCQQLPEQQF